MNRRIVSLAIALTLGTASGLLAQAPGNPPPAPAQGGQNRAAQRLQIMLQGITLTDVQKTRIDSIQAAFQAAMPAFQPGQARPDSAQMAQRREASQRRDTEIRAVLTAEQQVVWDRNAETMRQSMPQRP